MKPKRPELQMRLPLKAPCPVHLNGQEQAALAVTLAELLLTAASALTPSARTQGGADDDPEAHS